MAPTQNTWKTSEVINLEKTTWMYQKYKKNWNNLGLHRYKKQHYSENEEDGLLAGIFEEIGVRSKFFVEFGARDGSSISNTLLFRKDFGWDGLLMDLEHENPDIHLYREKVVAENINELFYKYHVPPQFDLLSIDIDSYDFWVWKALEPTYQPSVVIIEINQLVSPLEDRTIVYNADHEWEYDSCYFGAGLLTYFKLARSKGYSLVATIDQNAIFLRDDEVPYLKTEIAGINEVEKLFKPRIPRCYRNPASGEIIEYPREFVESMLPENEAVLSRLEPVIEKSMRRQDVKDQLWTTSGL